MSMPHWLLRLYEALGALALACVLVAVVFLLSGCSLFKEAQRERQLLFAPEGLPSNKQVFTRNYSEALKAVDAGTATPAEIVAYVDAGNALNARNCQEWLQRVTLARRGLIASDHDLGVASALITTLAGIFEWPSKTVAVLGAGGVALQGIGQNLQTDALAAPSPYQTQATLLGMLNTCSDQLLADAPGLRFSQAYARLETCARACSYEAAQATATNALSQTVTTVSPQSGALTTTAVTSAAVKDDAGIRLLAWWMPDGRVDASRDAQIKAWQRANGVDVSIPMLARGALYAAARAKAVLDLGVP